MLQAIRDRLKGWIAAVIFTLLIIPFAFWGVNYYFEQSGGVVAIKVNGEKITQGDYQRAYQNVRERWQALSQGTVNEQIEPLLKEQAIKSLIQAELFRQTTAALGLQISDEEVWDTIRQIPAFNDGNGFNMTLFVSAANQAGMTPAGLKAQLKEGMSSEQLRGAVLESAFVMQSEVDDFLRFQHQLRDFSYVLLSSDPLKETIEVSDEQINAYYEQDVHRYIEPAKVKIAYLVVSTAKVAEDVFLQAGEAETYFNENRENYEVAETRNVKQILIKLPEGAGDEILDNMRSRANELYDRVLSGKRLEEIVVKDTDSNIEFSEFGFLAKGVLEPEVDEVVFAMQAGEVSEPIQSKYGFHIMAVDEIKGGPDVTFESVRAEVEQDLKDDKAGKAIYELTDRLASLTYEHPDTLEVASDEMGIAILESDYLSKEEPGGGIVSDQKIISSAFSEPVLQGNNSDLIELDDERYVVLRLIDHQPAHKKPLDKVREQIITRIKYEQARDETREKGESILSKLKEGVSKEEVAAEFSIAWKEVAGIKRDDAQTNRAVIRTAFKAGKPAPGQVRFNGGSLGTGDYAIAIVTSVHEADPTNIEKEERDAVKNQLLSANSEINWAEFTEDLQEHATVKIYDEAL